MATTYTVANSFSADTTAVASEVNQNFTDVLTALNSYDASNLSSGTVPSARISSLTTTQIAAATLVIESEGIGSNDNDTTWPTSAAVKDYVDAHGAVQTVNTQTGASTTGTTAIPFDDTIPQSNEGDEYMTLAITPTSATNELKIEVNWNGSHSANTILTVALFQDAGADAIAAVANSPATNLAMQNMSFPYFMTAGSTSEITFKVRVGGSTGATTTFNGRSGSRIFGGVMASSITITEFGS